MTFRRLIIFGDSAFAEVAFEYFSRDTPYEVVAFAVEREYLKRDRLFDLPVVAIEDVDERFSPAEHDVYVATVYTQLNRLRARLCAVAEAKGYQLARYISPAAFVGPKVSIWPHCFIFEHNVLQPFVNIGRNAVLWSGNHVGHHSRIGNNVFVSSHVVISGFCDIGDNSFLGVNVSIANNTRGAEDCWIGPGVVIASDTKAGEIYRPARPEVARVDTYRRFGIAAQ